MATRWPTLVAVLALPSGAVSGARSWTSATGEVQLPADILKAATSAEPSAPQEELLGCADDAPKLLGAAADGAPCSACPYALLRGVPGRFLRSSAGPSDGAGSSYLSALRYYGATLPSDGTERSGMPSDDRRPRPHPLVTHSSHKERH